MRKLQYLILFILIGAVAFSRMLPHPPNFTPVMAVSLFCGALFGFRGISFSLALPLAAMVVSDFFIGFHPLSGVVYVSMVPAVLLGAACAGGLKPVGEGSSWGGLKWLGLGLIADLSFFTLSNLGVWWLSGFYEHSMKGLTECFVLALPFLHNQILGTGTFLGLLLFTWYGLTVLMGWRQPILNYQKYK